jgi:radical SAM superfamily enzyme YgiQ (UPF0313 family)
VVFLRPAWEPSRVKRENTYNRVWPPLSALYAATALRERGVSAEIRDLGASGQSVDDACRDLRRDDLVFLSTADVDRWQCPNVAMSPIYEAAEALRNAGARFVLTGTHGAVAPKALLRTTGADLAIAGEPEEASIRLGLDERSLAVSRADVPGVAWMEGDDLRRSAPAGTLDLTTLPSPDYSLVDLDRYRYEILGPRFALFEGSRGCPFPCAFCSRVLQGRKMRRKSQSQLIAEVDRAVRRDGVRSAYFIDLEFHLGGKTNLAVCEHLAGQNQPLAWSAQLRPREITDEWLDAMKAGGCRLVHCGIESGAPERLKALDKVSTVEEMTAGVERILKRGMDVLCFFILGFPDETESEIEATVRLALRLNPTYASFHLFTPYPGTEFAADPLTEDEAPRSGIAAPPAFFVPPTHPRALPFDVLSAARKRAYLRFYLRPSVAFRRIRQSGVSDLLAQARLFARQVWSR